MPANRKRNIQIPAEAILCSAGKNDEVEFYAYGVAVCCDKEVENPTKGNTTTQDRGTSNREVTSVNLAQGMRIEAVDGGIETVSKGILEEPQI